MPVPPDSVWYCRQGSPQHAASPPSSFRQNPSETSTRRKQGQGDDWLLLEIYILKIIKLIEIQST
jgi:hypothetical protein